MHHLFIIFILLLSLNGYGNEEETMPEGSTIPKAAINPVNIEAPPSTGCPDYAYCSKKFGTINKTFKKIIQKSSLNKSTKYRVLKSFAKKNGYLVSVWRKKIPKENNIILAWDSFCDNHQKKNILFGEIFIDKISDITKSSGNSIDYGYILRGKKIIKYPIPAKVLPIIADNKNLYFTIEKSGAYFNMSISSKGKIHYVEIDKVTEFPEHSDCPQVLIKRWKKDKYDKDIYSGYHCKKIWNIDKKKKETILLLHSC